MAAQGQGRPLHDSREEESGIFPWNARLQQEDGVEVTFPSLHPHAWTVGHCQKQSLGRRSNQHLVDATRVRHRGPSPSMVAALSSPHLQWLAVHRSTKEYNQSTTIYRCVIRKKKQKNTIGGLHVFFPFSLDTAACTFHNSASSPKKEKISQWVDSDETENVSTGYRFRFSFLNLKILTL